MYIRLLLAQLRPGQEDDLTRLARERVQPVVQGSPGYRGGYALVDRVAHGGGSVTLWDTAGDAEAFTRALRERGVLTELAAIADGQPRIETHEVTVEIPAGGA